MSLTPTYIANFNLIPFWIGIAVGIAIACKFRRIEIGQHVNLEREYPGVSLSIELTKEEALKLVSARLAREQNDERQEAKD